MQKIADNTKTFSVTVTAEQYMWLIEMGGTRGKSEVIRALIERAMDQTKEPIRLEDFTA